jgi:hypothetical protein
MDRWGIWQRGCCGWGGSAGTKVMNRSSGKTSPSDSTGLWELERWGSSSAQASAVQSEPMQSRRTACIQLLNTGAPFGTELMAKHLLAAGLSAR